MVNALIRELNTDVSFDLRINGPKRTFELATDKISAHVFRELQPRHLDLLEIASAIFMADSSLSRGGDTRPSMGQGWRRRFNIIAHVRDPDFWATREVSKALIEAINFLTEDQFRFQFERLDHPEPYQPYLALGDGTPSFQADEIVLFSGGLDSFSGTLELLSTTDKKVCLVTHRSAQKVIPRQAALGQYLVERFPKRVLHIQVKARRKGADQARETTQRSRSFLFAALGYATAHAFNAKAINFFENGVISHNLPLSRQIVGTMATRTTHPLALHRIAALLDMCSDMEIPLRNTFEWKTKAEVVRRIAENNAVDQIVQSVSCTSIREQDSLHSHCGECSQCLDRRFAMLACGLAEKDSPEIYKTDVLNGARDDVRSKTMAVEWTKHAISLADIGLPDFRAQFGFELARIARGFPDMPASDCAASIHHLHQRHGRAVKQAFESAIQSMSPLLVDRSLPETSLVRAYIGTGDALPTGIGTEMPSSLEACGGSDLDQPSEPLGSIDGRLVVSFSKDSGRYSVGLKNICQIVGAPAKAPVGLKPAFETDRAEGIPSSDHRFLQRLELPNDEMPETKEQLRSWVRHCRKQISENYIEIHGYAPDNGLLIETRPTKGYRLNPDIIIGSDF